jgi:hypothetical protein
MSKVEAAGVIAGAQLRHPLANSALSFAIVKFRFAAPIARLFSK